MLQTKEKKSALSPPSLPNSLPASPSLQPPETEGQRNNLTLGNWCGTEIKTPRLSVSHALKAPTLY